MVDRDNVVVLVPAKNGGRPQLFQLDPGAAELWRVSEGDLVSFDSAEDLQAQLPLVDSILTLNSLDLAEAQSRPVARLRRSQWERSAPQRWLDLWPHSVTTKMVDFCCPLFAGAAGIISGGHGSGLTYTLCSILDAITTLHTDCRLFCITTSRRAEEVTAMRRRFPSVAITACPGASPEVPAALALQVAHSVMSHAGRVSENGDDVVVLIDSLTDLWMLMLQEEDALDQQDADGSFARRKVRDLLQTAGSFHGETPLGAGPGGSITVLSTVWDRAPDEDAEQDRELNPAHRLLESIASDITWRLALSDSLHRARLYPAVEINRCLSTQEENVLDGDLYNSLCSARAQFRNLTDYEVYNRLLPLVDCYSGLEPLCKSLMTEQQPSSSRTLWDSLWAAPDEDAGT